MSRSKIQWNYVNMTSTYDALNGTNGVFQFTVKAEWKALPTRTLMQKIAFPVNPWRGFLANPKSKSSLVGSIHRNIFEIRGTGVSSCHVRMTDHYIRAIFVEFDLPTTPAKDFTRALEEIGEAKIAHPYFLNDEHSYQEGVSLEGVTTRVTFDSLPDHP